MWSRIQNTELATQAYLMMVDNAIVGCEYHNNHHIEQMYQYLEDTNEPYDECLDWAIMFHDIVYDSKPLKEYRSARMFSDMKTQYRGCYLNILDEGHVVALIMSTQHHIATYPSHSPIIRADLHALTNKAHCVNNFSKIMNESMKLYGCDVETFAKNNISFMSTLDDAMIKNMVVDPDHIHFYKQVQNGINITINIAKALGV